LGGTSDFNHAVVAEPVPKLNANFEEFFLRDIRELNHVAEALLDGCSQHFNHLVWLHHVSHLFYHICILLYYRGDSQGDLTSKVFEASLRFCVFYILELISE
jgi:hypothetical protein